MIILAADTMSKSELIQHLYDEINRQNTWYMWTVVGLIGVITLIVGYFSVLQWKVSDKQIDKMKTEIKAELADKIINNQPDVNDILDPFNNISSTKPRIIDDTTLIFSVLNSLKRISRMKNNSIYLNINPIPMSCVDLIAAVSPNLAQQEYVTSAVKQIQSLLLELYPAAIDYNSTIDRLIKERFAN